MSNGLKLPIKAGIADAKEAAFRIENTGGNVALAGSSAGGLVNVGVLGTSAPELTVEPGIIGLLASSIGVQGINNATVRSAVPQPSPNFATVSPVGVEGISNPVLAPGQGSGVRLDPIGVRGVSDNGIGVKGESTSGEGVFGTGRNGLHGRSSSPNDSGVWGENDGAGFGVSGSTRSSNTAGVWGDNQGTGQGIKGTSAGGDAVLGISTSKAHAGVSAVNDSGGFGIWARGRPAGHFEGNVELTGQLKAGSMEIGAFGAIIEGACSVGELNCDRDINCFGNINIQSGKDIFLADCAEEFETSQELSAEPGTVVVLGHESLVHPSDQPYDKRVAGVISGAGNFKPAIVLDKQQSCGHRVPVALFGRVYCKVDAQYASIEVGDLLTTSPTSGHAMKACDPPRAFGAVIGKALRSLRSGQGLIPILIALQ